MLRILPLLLIVIVIYNLIVLGAPLLGQPDIQDMLSLNHAIPVHMFSGDVWKLSSGDILIVLGLVLLFAETVKSTRTNTRQLVNHGLSMLVFLVALVEFIALKGFSTSTYFFLVLMTMFDVVAGYTISVIAAEHDLGLGRAGTD